MKHFLSSKSVNIQVDELLLSGQAAKASHEAIKLLMAHGGRRLEDALP